MAWLPVTCVKQTVPTCSSFSYSAELTGSDLQNVAAEQRQRFPRPRPKSGVGSRDHVSQSSQSPRQPPTQRLCVEVSTPQAQNRKLQGG